MVHKFGAVRVFLVVVASEFAAEAESLNDAWNDAGSSQHNRRQQSPNDALVIEPEEDSYRELTTTMNISIFEDPSALDRETIAAAAETKDFWMQSDTTQNTADRPTFNKKSMPADDDTSESHWYDGNTNKRMKSSTATQNDAFLDPSADDKATIAAAASKQDFWMGGLRGGTDNNKEYPTISLERFKKELHYNDDDDDTLTSASYADTMKKLSIDDIIQQKDKLLSIIKQQDDEIEKMDNEIDILTNKQLQYESEIKRLERTYHLRAAKRW